MEASEWIGRIKGIIDIASTLSNVLIMYIWVDFIFVGIYTAQYNVVHGRVHIFINRE